MEESMGLDSYVVDQLVALVREQFPDWAGFDHEGFRHDERDYKVAAVEKAIGPDGLLKEPALRDDLDGRAFNSFIERFDKIGHVTNLLYQSVPMSGDLSALYHAREKTPEVLEAYCLALFDLLWGEGPSPERLGRYVEFVTANDLPNKWTLPTYFLFLTHPEEDMFIKPRTMARVAKHLDADWSLAGAPTGEEYGRILDWARELRAALEPLGAEDMIDVQSLLWTAGWQLGQSAEPQEEPARPARCWKVAPGEGASVWSDWQEHAHISVGWEQLGDLSELTPDEWPAHRDRICGAYGWTTTSADQCWRFAKDIAPGDRIVANRGTKGILGFGTVVGEYYFVPDEPMSHRMPVRWDDVRPRALPQPNPGWRRTLLKLSPDGFDALLALPPEPGSATLGPPFDKLFADRAEAEAALDLMADALDALGVTANDDKRFAVTYATNSRGMTLDYGPWCVMRCWPVEQPRRLQLALLEQSGVLDDLPVDFRFKEAAEDRPVVLRTMEPSVVDDHIRSASIETAREAKALFGHRQSSNWRKYHIDEIGAALLDQAKRDALLTKGLSAASPEPKPVPILEPVDHPNEEMNPAYSLEDLATETSLPKETLERWLRAIERKGQAILYGPPGTGKTYVAERLAKHLVAGGTGMSELVQFHPAYAYEDFMQGIRPKAREGGGLDYPVVDGRFKQFCRQARGRKGLSVLVIDEVNRANLARVFGELMYLLEYRDKSIPLAAGGAFSIPGNVRIIGTMNTADRSIALVDHALRRRFAFLPLYPDYQMLTDFHAKANRDFDPTKLIGVLKELNRKIGDHHYEVGTSFFMRGDIEDQLPDVWRMEIEPYLEEYFFDQQATVDAYRWDEVSKKLGLE
jgi:5-methylcytosine-specific restriction protein B